MNQEIVNGTMTYELNSSQEVIDYFNRNAKEAKTLYDPYFQKKHPKETLRNLMFGRTIEASKFKMQVGKIVTEHIKTEIKEGVMYGMSGDYIDIGRYLTGDPECCGYQEVCMEQRCLLEVIVNKVATGKVSYESLFNRGIIIASMLDILSKDYYIDLKVVESGDNVDGSEVNLKTVYHLNTKDGFSFNQLINYIVDPDFYRTVMFGIREGVFGVEYIPYLKVRDIPVIEYTDNPNVVYFPAMFNDGPYLTLEGAKVKVMKMFDMYMRK